MIKRLAFTPVILLVAWPVVAQVTTIPVGSLTQTSVTGATLTLAVSLRGYPGTATGPTVPLPNQTVKVAPIALLQPQIPAEFPVTNTIMTVTEVAVTSTIQTSTSQTSAETRAKLPSPITVGAANRVKVVYSVPAGQQPQLQFQVGAPTTPTGGASPSGTRITQVGQSFIGFCRQQVESRCAEPGRRRRQAARGSCAPRRDKMASCSAQPWNSFGRT